MTELLNLIEYFEKNICLIKKKRKKAEQTILLINLCNKRRSRNHSHNETHGIRQLHIRGKGSIKRAQRKHKKNNS